MNRTRLVLAFVGASASPALAQNFIETFENGVNAGGWDILGCPGGGVLATGGYPGGCFGGLCFGYPSIGTHGASPFTGDWTTRGDTTFAVDLNTIATQGGNLPLTLMLISDAGTSSDPDDDWAVYMPFGQLTPAPGTGWMYFSIFVPGSTFGTLPECWEFWDIGSNPPATRNWNDLMHNVAAVRILYAPPGTTTNFPSWNIKVDNIEVRAANVEASCYANCTHSTNTPFLTAHDFQCFLNAYASGCPAPPTYCYANCDLSTSPPILNVNDFMCFLNAYAAGCSAP